jgi:structural maintenance of chromosome 4
VLQGLFGRLGDLGSIDAKFDAAVSSATGALDNLVVDNTSNAQRCVNYLRTHNLGVATFLILEKQQKFLREMDDPVTPPEGVPRLFDCIKCNDDKMRTAFFFALRHTLVAKDIDQASRIGHHSKDPRFSRVVTLQVWRIPVHMQHPSNDVEVVVRSVGLVLRVASYIVHWDCSWISKVSLVAG